MNFDDLLVDIGKLAGLELHSIKPGSNIMIQTINRSEGRIIIRTGNNQIKSRPIAEIQKIWEHLCAFPVVRVENALQGAGSSRNHPETILANLPYIEWLLVDGKKHICLVESSTHPYGTLREVENIQAEIIRDKLRNTKEELDTISEILVVASDITDAANQIQDLTGKRFSPVDKGIYRLRIDKARITIVTPQILNLKPGTYPVISCENHTDISYPIDFLGKKYYLFSCNNGINLLVRQL